MTNSRAEEYSRGTFISDEGQSYALKPGNDGSHEGSPGRGRRERRSALTRISTPITLLAESENVNDSAANSPIANGGFVARQFFQNTRAIWIQR